MFNVITWVSYDTWLSDPIPLEEVEKNFYVLDEPKNEEILRKLMNQSIEDSPHLFRGFVQVTYNGEEIFGQLIFSLIIHVWATYENLLIETYEKGYANLSHPEGDVIAISVQTDKNNPTLLQISVFPDSLEFRKDFSLPKQTFLKAMYDGLVAYYTTYASYCENEEIKLNLINHLEIIKKRLSLYIS